MEQKIGILTSTKFWALVASVIVSILGTKGVIPHDLAMQLLAFFVGYIPIKAIYNAEQSAEIITMSNDNQDFKV